MINFLAVNRVAFSIGGFDVYFYGILICSAMIVAILVDMLYSKLKKYGADMPLTIALVILPVGILSARLFSVIFEPGLSISDYFNFRTGGLSIIGGILGGGLGMLIFCLIKKEKNPFKYFDTLCVVLLLAMAIGRWGNYFNGEVFGQVIPADSPFAKFPLAVKIDGVFYQALFFYESILDLIGFIGLSFVYFFTDNTYTTAGLLIYYGIVRSVLETFRQSQYVLKLGSIPVSQIMSFVMIAVGLAILIYKIVRTVQKKKVKKYDKK